MERDHGPSAEWRGRLSHHTLREEVGRTVSDPAEVDEEVHALREALIVSGDRA